MDEELPGTSEKREAEDFNFKSKEYPRSIFLIYAIEFCERFSYGCFSCSLVLFLRDKFRYRDIDAGVFYHTFVMLASLTPLIGGSISDSVGGKFWAMCGLSIVYVVGDTVMVFSASDLIGELPILVIGLILVLIPTGGIRACSLPLGADQFLPLEQQQRQFHAYFYWHYFFQNAGILAALASVPIMFHFMDFLLPYSVATVLMALGAVIFLCGKRSYKINKPKGLNTVINVPKSIIHAIIRKIKGSHRSEDVPHWMDRVSDVYGLEYIEEVKILLRIMYVSTPFPIFWTLCNQQGSSWVQQAARLDGDIGAIRVLPEYVQLINPILMLLIIPLAELFVVPLVQKVLGKPRPLKKMIFSGFVMSLAFLFAMILEAVIQLNKAPIPRYEYSQFRVYNGFDCPLAVMYADRSIYLEPLRMHADLQMRPGQILKVNWTSPHCYDLPPGPARVELRRGEANSLFISPVPRVYKDDAMPSEDGTPKLRILGNVPYSRRLAFINTDTNVIQLTRGVGRDSLSGMMDMPVGIYDIYLGDKYLTKKLLGQGGAYTLVVAEDLGTYRASLNSVVPPNYVGILWMFPQYVALSVAEIVFTVSGLEFYYTESPPDMRAFAQTLWWLNVAVGNVLYIVIMLIFKLHDQTFIFLFFTATMLSATMALFMLEKRHRYSEMTLSVQMKIDD